MGIIHKNGSFLGSKTNFLQGKKLSAEKKTQGYNNKNEASVLALH